MLKKISGNTPPAWLRIGDAQFPEPFPASLEYSPPARGTWNIVHTGMLVPQSHQIYICAIGCIRGVILTAAEMGAMDRFSTVIIEEKNILKGDIEALMLDGIADILQRLPELPPAVLVFTSCIHHFLGCNMPFVYRKLRERFPQTAFAECTMDPIRRKSGLTAEQSCRKSIYDLLQPALQEKHAVNLLGNDLPTLENSELLQLLKQNGWTIRDLTLCQNYADFQAMARASLNLYYNPDARFAAKALTQRLGQPALYLPLSYDFAEIAATLQKLAAQLQIPTPDYTSAIQKTEAALRALREEIGSIPLALDYSVTFRPFSLARLLVRYGFCLERIYADVIAADDRADFLWLQNHAPEIRLYPTKQPWMRRLKRSTDRRFLAIGQKAAYFTGSDYFVNLVETGGLYGFAGIQRFVELLQEAFHTPKDCRKLIQQKGWGGTCCL